VRQTENRGKGLFVKQGVRVRKHDSLLAMPHHRLSLSSAAEQKHSLIVEYVGEVIGPSELKKRMAEGSSSYYMALPDKMVGGVGALTPLQPCLLAGAISCMT
jgi:hypothetical protein